jgi:HAMP domain-containing protein
MTVKEKPRTIWHRLNFRNWRISTKLLVVMVILALVPAALVTAIGTRTGTEALIDEAQLNLIRLANSTAQRFDQLLLDNQNYIRMTAGEGEIVHFLELPEDEHTAEMYHEVNFEINRLLASNPLINLVSIFNHEGVVEAHTDPQYVGQNYFFREYVQSALEGQAYTTGIAIGVRDNKPGVISSTPVRDRLGKIIGVVSARIMGDYITNILESTLEMDSTDLPKEELSAIDIYLVNEYGIVVSHSDQESEWLYHSLGTIEDQQTLDLIVADKLLGGDCPDDILDCDASVKIARQPIPIPALQLLGDELLDAFKTGETGTFIYCRPENLTDPLVNPELENCSGNRGHTIGYAPVARPDSNGGTILFMVVVDVPDYVFLSGIEAFVGKGLMVTAIVGLISLLVALIVARLIAKPVGSLARAAQDVEQDKPFEPDDIAEVIAQGDEVGHLARVFSDMVMALRARMAELQTIYEIGQEISAGVELEETLRYILASIRGVIPYEMAELGFFDQAKNRMIIRAAADINATEEKDVVSYYEPETARFYDVNEGILARLVKEGSALLIANMTEDADLEFGAERKWGGSGAKSYLGVVLKTIIAVCLPVLRLKQPLRFRTRKSFKSVSSDWHARSSRWTSSSTKTSRSNKSTIL